MHISIQSAAAVLMLVAFLAAPATAAQMNDPTRPPPRVVAKPAAREVAEEALQLQSVLISPAGRSAIINGSLVALGGRIGNARLMQVSEDEAIVEIDGRWQRLRLFPAARKAAASSGTQGDAARDSQGPLQNAHVVSVVRRRAVRE